MTLPLIAIVLSMWVIVGIAVAVFLATPRRKPDKPRDLSGTGSRLPKPLAMPAPPLQPTEPTSRSHP